MTTPALGDMHGDGAPPLVRHRWTVTIYLVGLIALFVTALASTTIYQDRAATKDARNGATRDAQFAADATATRVGADIDAARSTTTATAATPGLVKVFASPAGCSLKFAALGAFATGHLDIVSTDGTAVCSSLGASQPSVYRSSGWLRDALSGPVLVGPVVDARTGEQAVIVAVPILGGGSVVAFLDLESLAPSLAKSFGGSRQLEFLVTTADGRTALSRSIEPHRWVGQSLAGTDFTRMPAERAGADVDGTDRLYGMTDVATTGWRIFAGASRSAAAAPATKITHRNLALSACFLLVFLMAALVIHRRVGRPIRRLSAQVRSVTAGKESEQIGMSGAAEVATLAEDFANLIAARDRELTAVSQLAATKAAILESAIDCVITIDDQGRIVEFNPAAERSFGYQREDVVGQAMDALIIPAPLRDAHRAGLAHCRATGEGPILSRRMELTAMRSDGTEFPVELTVTPVDLPGTPLFTGYLRDLTEQTQARAELAESEHRLQTILDASPAIVHVKDVDGRYLFVNTACEQLFDMKRDDMIGYLDLELFQEKMARISREEDLAVLLSGRPRQSERVAAHPDGERTYLSVKFPLFDVAGTAYATAGISTDITERKRAEAERQSLQDRLNQSQRLESLGQLAGGVAHDFNNLLAVILNYASFVAEETTDDVRADVEQILAAAKRATRLTHQLLMVARRDTVNPEQLDLNIIVEEMRGLLARSIGEDVHLVVDIEESLPAMHADRGQIDQVLLNLAINARDAMPDGGTLTIETRCIQLDEEYARRHPGMHAGRYIQLSVSDTGVGMSPDVAARAFEPFFTTKPQGQGTGLGLATVYGIVAEAGGAVNVHSEEGVGTTFRIYLLPAATSALPVHQGSDTAFSHGHGETILVVEDEPAMLEVTTRLLRRNGYRVLQAASGEAALALAAQNDFQLLLTDSVMPAMSGSVLSENLKATYPTVPVLFMSGYSKGVLGPRRLVDENIPLIQKPFTEHELLVKVSAVLGER